MSRKLRALADLRAMQHASTCDMQAMWQGYVNASQHPDGWVGRYTCRGESRRILLARSGAISLLDPHTPEQEALAAIAGDARCVCHKAVTRLVGRIVHDVGDSPAGLEIGARHMARRAEQERWLGRGSSAHLPRTDGPEMLAQRFWLHVAGLARRAWHLHRGVRPVPLRGANVRVIVNCLDVSMSVEYSKRLGSRLDKAGRDVTIRLNQTWANNVLRRGMVTARDSAYGQWVILDSDMVPNATGGYRCLAMGPSAYQAWPGMVRRVGRGWHFEPDTTLAGAAPPRSACHCFPGPQMSPRNSRILDEVAAGARLRYVSDRCAALTEPSSIPGVPGRSRIVDIETVIDPLVDCGLLRLMTTDHKEWTLAEVAHVV